MEDTGERNVWDSAQKQSSIQCGVPAWAPHELCMQPLLSHLTIRMLRHEHQPRLVRLVVANHLPVFDASRECYQLAQSGLMTEVSWHRIFTVFARKRGDVSGRGPLVRLSRTLAGVHGVAKLEDDRLQSISVRKSSSLINCLSKLIHKLRTLSGFRAKLDRQSIIGCLTTCR